MTTTKLQKFESIVQCAGSNDLGWEGLSLVKPVRVRARGLG